MLWLLHVADQIEVQVHMHAKRTQRDKISIILSVCFTQYMLISSEILGNALSICVRNFRIISITKNGGEGVNYMTLLLSLLFH